MVFEKNSLKRKKRWGEEKPLKFKLITKKRLRQYNLELGFSANFAVMYF